MMMQIAGFRCNLYGLCEPDEPKFQSQCEQLRNNDADTVKVYARSGFSFRGYGFRLGQALLKNTVVERVHLDLDSFFSASGIKGIEAAPMLDYMSTSRALHSVALHSRNSNTLDDFGLGAKILKAVASNPCVKSVSVNCKLRVQDFLHLVSNVPHVCSLFIGYKTFAPFFHFDISAADGGAIFDAFAANTNLERLSLDCCCMPKVWVEQFLNRLRFHCRLRHLEIHFWNQEPEVLYLQNVLVSSTVLTSLFLRAVKFDLEASDLLCEGLRSNRTCRKLSLRYCEFTNDATNNMITFFNRDANRSTCVLSEVHLNALEETFEGSEVRNVIRAILGGSALNKFELYAHQDDVASLFHELSQHAGEIQVPSLQFQFHSPTKAEMVALCSFLRATTTLQDVRVSACASSSARILSALRENGSLLRAGFFENGFPERALNDCYEFPFGASIFDETQQARAETYLKRNEMAPQMVVAPGAVDNNVANIATGGPNLARELFVVATHAPRTAPSTILRGLKADWAKDVGSTVSHNTRLFATRPVDAVSNASH